jgi:hypothetical protein
VPSFRLLIPHSFCAWGSVSSLGVVLGDIAYKKTMSDETQKIYYGMFGSKVGSKYQNKGVTA